ncbi:MAG TPA: hypothetical protein VF808_08290 [Ktedonobacterales bacterium]
MVPSSYIAFFSVSAGAAATLIGLLFVAVSVAPERTVGKRASSSRRSVAESAFTALLNPFLISLIALIPVAPLSIGTLAITGATLLNAVRSLALMIIRWRREPPARALERARLLLLPVSMLVIYGLEFWWAASVYHEAAPSQDEMSRLASILITLEGLAIVRCWELLGAQRNSLFSLIGGLEEPDDDAPAGKAE